MKIVKDSNDQYHSQDSISASGLKEISKNSVYHYLNRLPFESSAMALGTAVHTALLAPDTFYDIYYPSLETSYPSPLSVIPEQDKIYF